jgi:hypothetical protein
MAKRITYYAIIDYRASREDPARGWYGAYGMTPASVTRKGLLNSGYARSTGRPPRLPSL